MAGGQHEAVADRSVEACRESWYQGGELPIGKDRPLRMPRRTGDAGGSGPAGRGYGDRR